MNHEHDILFMRRALQLAKLGYGFTSPNPMVGCVITDPAEKIIGEGFHRQWGGPHAEVNAVRSVTDPESLRGSTVYVTLEPCSHWGKTPPCADLLADSCVGRVVVGCPDPFPKVSGRGVRRLRDAGIRVDVGVLEHECKELNRKFMYAHSHGRPYVMLKWAQSRDGYMTDPRGKSYPFSSPTGQLFMHRERAGADAIMAGNNTLRNDDPALTLRHWPGRHLRPVMWVRPGTDPVQCRVLDNPDTIVVCDCPTPGRLLNYLYCEHGITSLMVEGGAQMLDIFISGNLWQEMRIEVAPLTMEAGVKAPSVNTTGHNPLHIGPNLIYDICNCD